MDTQRDFFSKIRNFWAWADKLGWNFLRHLGYFRPNNQHYFGTVSPLSMRKCIWFFFLQKTLVFRSTTYNSQITPKYDIGRKEFAKYSLHMSVVGGWSQCGKNHSTSSLHHDEQQQSIWLYITQLFEVLLRTLNNDGFLWYWIPKIESNKNCTWNVPTNINRIKGPTNPPCGANRALGAKTTLWKWDHIPKSKPRGPRGTNWKNYDLCRYQNWKTTFTQSNLKKYVIMYCIVWAISVFTIHTK